MKSLEVSLTKMDKKLIDLREGLLRAAESKVNKGLDCSPKILTIPVANYRNKRILGRALCRKRCN